MIFTDSCCLLNNKVGVTRLVTNERLLSGLQINLIIITLLSISEFMASVITYNNPMNNQQYETKINYLLLVD